MAPSPAATMDVWVESLYSLHDLPLAECRRLKREADAESAERAAAKLLSEDVAAGATSGAPSFSPAVTKAKKGRQKEGECGQCTTMAPPGVRGGVQVLGSSPRTSPCSRPVSMSWSTSPCSRILRLRFREKCSRWFYKSCIAGTDSPIFAVRIRSPVSDRHWRAHFAPWYGRPARVQGASQRSWWRSSLSQGTPSLPPERDYSWCYWKTVLRWFGLRHSSRHKLPDGNIITCAWKASRFARGPQDLPRAHDADQVWDVQRVRPCTCRPYCTVRFGTHDGQCDGHWWRRLAHRAHLRKSCSASRHPPFGWPWSYWVSTEEPHCARVISHCRCREGVCSWCQREIVLHCFWSRHRAHIDPRKTDKENTYDSQTERTSPSALNVSVTRKCCSRQISPYETCGFHDTSFLCFKKCVVAHPQGIVHQCRVNRWPGERMTKNWRCLLFPRWRSYLLLCPSASHSAWMRVHMSSRVCCLNIVFRDCLQLAFFFFEKSDSWKGFTRRTNAKEVLISQKGDECIFPAADGTAQLSGRDYGFRKTILRREQTQPTESTDDAEVRRDFCSIHGDFIYRHHNEPRVQLCVPKERNIPFSTEIH